MTSPKGLSPGAISPPWIFGPVSRYERPIVMQNKRLMAIEGRTTYSSGQRSISAHMNGTENWEAVAQIQHVVDVDIILIHDICRIKS